jgi:hypothetical protein
MRHDDSDESDEPTHCDGGSRAECRGDHDDETNSTNIGSESRRFIITHSKHIEQPTMQQECGRTDDHVWNNQSHIVPCGSRQPTEDPRVDLSYDIGVSLQHECL